MRILLLFAAVAACAAEAPLGLSVYATAGDIQRYLATDEGRQRTESALRRLGISKIFLEGRRGDEYVPPATLRDLRQYFKARGFETSGGIATVPGKTFGARQNTALGWLDWESEKTRRDIAGFFRENAAVFDELVVDDFYCTADTSPSAEKARGGRPWSDYRRDLMVGLMDPLIVRPAREVNPGVRLILKYPQWYDRFHLFGYDPPRMSPPFGRIWVGTEVRNPETRRMGFVQPTEGYMNFRWISSVAGRKVEGAWFDHIECTARNFVDQAYQSVLAGARELTLFHLGDVVEGHPGHALLQAALPELRELAAATRDAAPSGLVYYKPPSSNADDNVFLMDYLGMLGLPVVPEARYPASARAVMLGAQAAGDPQLTALVTRHLKTGATVVLTPALVRRAGAPLARLAKVRISAQPRTALATRVTWKDRQADLIVPLEIDAGLEAEGAYLTATAAGAAVPYLVERRVGSGRLLVWNVRTFSEQDYQEAGEWLLAPKKRGLAEMPRELADDLRRRLAGLELSAPTRVGFYLLGGKPWFYNFRDEPVEVRYNGQTLRIAANRLATATPRAKDDGTAASGTPTSPPGTATSTSATAVSPRASTSGPTSTTAGIPEGPAIRQGWPSHDRLPHQPRLEKRPENGPRTLQTATVRAQPN